MTQYGDSNVPPSIGAPAAGGGNAAPFGRPQVIHIVAKPGGFWRAVRFIIGLFLFAAVFFIGLTLGIFIMFAGANLESLVVRETYREGGSRIVAIIPVDGVINERQAEFVRYAVDNVLHDRKVAAVVLRVDSPGGGVTASDEIWYEVNRLKDHNVPVVASFGSVAASGGYYVSCGANYIMAQETSITGSIGVIAQILTLEGLLNKVGVQPVTLVASGSPEKAVANDIFRSWNEQDKAKVQVMLDSAYATFTKRVRDGRKNTIPDQSQLDAIANGSIYTAQQAKDNGLVDAIGYLDDAIAVAETRGGLTTGSSTVVLLQPPPSLSNALFGAQGRERAISLTGSMNADSIRAVANDLASPRVMYLMH